MEWLIGGFPGFFMATVVEEEGFTMGNVKRKFLGVFKIVEDFLMSGRWREQRGRGRGANSSSSFFYPLLNWMFYLECKLKMPSLYANEVRGKVWYRKMPGLHPSSLLYIPLQ